jgi:hypothetical protein
MCGGVSIQLRSVVTTSGGSVPRTRWTRLSIDKTIAREASANTDELDLRVGMSSWVVCP